MLKPSQICAEFGLSTILILYFNSSTLDSSNGHNDENFKPGNILVPLPFPGLGFLCVPRHFLGSVWCVGSALGMKGFLQIVLGMVIDCKRFRFRIFSTCLTPRPLISLGSYNRFILMTQVVEIFWLPSIRAGKFWPPSVSVSGIGASAPNRTSSY